MKKDDVRYILEHVTVSVDKKPEVELKGEFSVDTENLRKAIKVRLYVTSVRDLSDGDIFTRNGEVVQADNQYSTRYDEVVKYFSSVDEGISWVMTMIANVQNFLAQVESMIPKKIPGDIKLRISSDSVEILEE